MSKTPRTSKKSISTETKSTRTPNKVTTFDAPQEYVDKFEGFVYLIENLVNGKLYIGRKYFWSYTSKPPLKGKKRRRKERNESNWRTYTGSCPELHDDMKKYGMENFRFEILSFHTTKGKTNYAEAKEQFARDVLYARENGEYVYYNTNILARFYRGRI